MITLLHHKAPALLLVASIAVIGGCGVLTARQTDFPNAETGVDGQVLILDELRDIVNDPDLDDVQKRQALRDMGIEDVDLIEVILTLPAS